MWDAEYSLASNSACSTPSTQHKGVRHTGQVDNAAETDGGAGADAGIDLETPSPRGRAETAWETPSSKPMPRGRGKPKRKGSVYDGFETRGANEQSVPAKPIAGLDPDANTAI